MTTPSYSDARNNQSSDIFEAESIEERLLSVAACWISGTNPDGTPVALTPSGGGGGSATAANQVTQTTALGTLATDAHLTANTAAVVALGTGALATDAHLTALGTTALATDAHLTALGTTALATDAHLTALGTTLLATDAHMTAQTTAIGLLAPAPSQPVDQGLSATLAINSLGNILDNGVPRSSHTMTYIANGANTAGVLTLMGSLDGANFFIIPGGATITTNGTSAVISITGVPFRYIRAKITTGITGGTGVGVKVASC